MTSDNGFSSSENKVINRGFQSIWTTESIGRNEFFAEASSSNSTTNHDQELNSKKIIRSIRREPGNIVGNCLTISFSDMFGSRSLSRQTSSDFRSISRTSKLLKSARGGNMFNPSSSVGIVLSVVFARLLLQQSRLSWFLAEAGHGSSTGDAEGATSPGSSFRKWSSRSCTLLQTRSM